MQGWIEQELCFEVTPFGVWGCPPRHRENALTAASGAHGNLNGLEGDVLVAEPSSVTETQEKH
jgi:hypothetical protein